MKKHMRKILSAVTAFLLSTAMSQAQPPKPPIHETMQTLSSFTGKIVSFLPNEDRIYDAFELDQNGIRQRVAFPKHLGKAIMAAAKPGNTVTVNGFLEYSPAGVQEIRLVSMSSGSQTVYDIRKIPAPPAAEQFVAIESSIVDFKRNREGQVDGLILKDQSILHFPKHIGYQLASLKPCDVVKATGYVEGPEEGVVAAEPHRMVRTETITLHGTNYLVR